MPMPKCYSHIRKQLLDKIERGEILLGELIEPKTYIRVKLEEGKLVKETFQVHGRKLPLDEIRLRIFNEHKALGILVFFDRILFISWRYLKTSDDKSFPINEKLTSTSVQKITDSSRNEQIV